MTREDWLNAFIEASRPLFSDAGTPLPQKIRASIGFTSHKKAIGECWISEASEDGHCEIFIVPSLQSDAARVGDIMTHELCHAALGAGMGHRREFKRLAVSLGLTGPMRSTIAGERWHTLHEPILAALGAFPAASLVSSQGEGAPKKQGTRMIKLTCECGWSCRTTETHINGALLCPTLCGSFLERN